MAFISGNKIRIAGDGNIVLQDIADSTININSDDNQRIDDFIKEVNGVFKKRLTVLVVSTTDSKVTKIPTLSQDIPFTKFYGDTVEKWKPFEKSSIIDILRDCAKILKIELQVFSFDSIFLKDDKIISSLKYIKPKTLLIIDSLVLHFPENQMLAGLFNDYHIGGCIAVSSIKIPEIEKIKTEVFKHLLIYLNDKEFPDSTIHLQSVNKIESEIDLFNALKNTILYLLKMRKVDTETTIDVGLKDIQL